MYRKSLADMANNSVSKLPNPVDSSAFLQRLVKLPIVHSALTVASDYYGKAKNSGGIIGKTIGVAERTAIGVAGKAVPYAQILTPLAAQPLEKFDSLANYGLEKLESTVPVITKEPQVIYSETKQLVTDKVSPAVNKINSMSEVVLGTKLAQFGLDIVENSLDIAANVINRFLPADSSSEKNGQQNGYLHESAPEDKTARVGYLFRKALYLANNVAKRVFGLAQSRVDSAVSVTDNVVNSARKTLNNILDKTELSEAPQQNGDHKPSRKHKKSQ